MQPSRGFSSHKSRRTPYSIRLSSMMAFRRVVKVPLFVPPILIVINIYLILNYRQCKMDSPLQLISRERRQVNEQEVSDEILQQQRVNNRRIRRVAETCAKLESDQHFANQKLTGTVLATPDYSFLYCDVPKVGCTYWKQVFRFLTHDYEGRVSRPEEIPRVYAHFGPWTKTQLISLTEKENLEKVNNADLKFMISRDPYARLWSGYLDKLYLPDFWWWLGTKVVAENRPNANADSKKCGHDVTFTEFLQFTTEKLLKGKTVDQHFSPNYARCNPCKINFDFIGKMETFGADTKLILSHTNISKMTAHASTVLEDRNLVEMKTLTIYNFDIQTRLTDLGKNSDCYNQADIAERLWKTFQFNGYLGDEEEFPYEEIQNIQNKDLIKQSILEKIVAIRTKTPPEVMKTWTDQRDIYLHKAYSNVPMKILKGVRDAYKRDFELFDYESEPDYIFKR
ncbi:hypothetical protein ACF0H5_024079 [Mactra antiquata]